jgi:hypothetical protein
MLESRWYLPGDAISGRMSRKAHGVLSKWDMKCEGENEQDSDTISNDIKET